jgi:hypothetical protein
MTRGRAWWSFVAALVTAAALATPGAVGAAAPSAVGRSFVRALVNGDPAACAHATERLQRLLARRGEANECVAAFRNGTSAAAAADRAARTELASAHAAAKVVIRERARQLRSPRYWTSTRFRLAALARELREYQTDARLGSGPAAARNTPTGRVIVDRARSTRTVLVLYTESESGTIRRLTGTTARKGTATRTATRGLPGSGAVSVALAYPAAAAGVAPRVAVFARLGPVSDAAFLLTMTAEPRAG